MSHADARTGEPRTSESRPSSERLIVGLVRSIHGLRGAIRVEILTDQPEKRFEQGAVLHPEGSVDRLTVAHAAPDGPGWLVRFAELLDRNAAETLRGRYLEADVPSAERAADDSYYWHEVVGSAVRDQAGELLGSVVDIYRAGGAEVYLVRGEPYGEFDVPAVRQIVLSFEPNGAGIVIDPAALGLVPAKAPRPPSAPRTAKRPKPPGAPRTAKPPSPSGEPRSSRELGQGG